MELVALLPALVLLALAGWQSVLIGWSMLEARARGPDRRPRGDDRRLAGRRCPLCAAGPLARGSAGHHQPGGRLLVRLAVPSVIPGLAPHVTASAPVVRQ